LCRDFGIVVFVFQQGHGSAIWGIGATQSIAPWLPLMIFAFLYGLSMDYEVFMLTRIREAYDQTGSTHKAIELGLARTGKLVTSAAFILMFAFLLLSTSPGYESKEFAIALVGGIIFDATVIRALLVPALMRLLGNANWWMPSWTRTILLSSSSSAAGRPARVAPRTRRPKSLTSRRRPESACRLRSSPSRVLRAFGSAGPELFAKPEKVGSPLGSPLLE
jgi:RND superfamily putative drug exporter